MRSLMPTVIVSLLVWGVGLIGYGQCEADELFFIDAAGNQIGSAEANGIFIIKDGRDSLFLRPLYDHQFTTSWRYLDFEVDDAENKETNSEELETEALYFCTTCDIGVVILIDSIDVNNDGVKELILWREWNCSVNPSNRGAHGVRVQYQTYSRYEIWDVQAKKQLIEINNNYRKSVAITTNLVEDYGYRYEVKLNADGTFLFSNGYGTGADFEMGTYCYDAASNTLIKIG